MTISGHSKQETSLLELNEDKDWGNYPYFFEKTDWNSFKAKNWLGCIFYYTSKSIFKFEELCFLKKTGNELMRYFVHPIS